MVLKSNKIVFWQPYSSQFGVGFAYFDEKQEQKEPYNDARLFCQDQNYQDSQNNRILKCCCIGSFQ